METAPPRGEDSPYSPNRRRVPRTDLLLADPRLVGAERRLGRPLVKAAAGRAQQRARDGQIAPEKAADAAVAELPARASALALVLAATALTSSDVDEIVVSRGELIEIGDRFRLPDLLVSTGTRLREVGTTNRTTAADYADAAAPPSCAR